MTLYSTSFGFRQPYQVLGESSLFDSFFLSQLWVVVDSDMCKTAHQGVMDLPNQLATVLQGTVKLSAFCPLSTLSFRLIRPRQVK